MQAPQAVQAAWSTSGRLGATDSALGPQVATQAPQAVQPGPISMVTPGWETTVPAPRSGVTLDTPGG